MAVTPTNGYCTGDVLKAALQISDATDDVALTAAIDAASRTIDEWCGRRFYVDGADSTRYFTATDPRTVTLSGQPSSVDIVSVTTVQVDQSGTGTFGETWTEGADFVLGPRSATADGRPFQHLQLLGGRTAPVGVRDAVKVTGTFGWAVTPDPVERACVALASQVFKQERESPFGVASFDLEGGVLRMSRFLPGHVEMMLRPYRVVGTVAGYV